MDPIDAHTYAKIEWPAVGTPPDVLYICGYRRTGKDTFAADIQSGTSRYARVLYAPVSARADGSLLPLRRFMGAPRVAFADALRTAALAFLGLPPSYDCETTKDLPLPPECTAAVAPLMARLGRPATLRDVLIHIGERGRAVDPAHWVKKALGPFYRPVGQPPQRVIVSDWRFVGELEQARAAGIAVTTVRLFRIAVPIPPQGIVTEHDLDATPTDWLCIPLGDDPDVAFATFPQYRGYAFSGVVHGDPVQGPLSKEFGLF